MKINDYYLLQLKENSLKNIFKGNFLDDYNEDIPLIDDSNLYFFNNNNEYLYKTYEKCKYENSEKSKEFNSINKSYNKKINEHDDNNNNNNSSNNNKKDIYSIFNSMNNIHKNKCSSCGNVPYNDDNFSEKKGGTLNNCYGKRYENVINNLNFLKSNNSAHLNKFKNTSNECNLNNPNDLRINNINYFYLNRLYNGNLSNLIENNSNTILNENAYPSFDKRLENLINGSKNNNNFNTNYFSGDYIPKLIAELYLNSISNVNYLRNSLNTLNYISLNKLYEDKEKKNICYSSENNSNNDTIVHIETIKKNKNNVSHKHSSYINTSDNKMCLQSRFFENKEKHSSLDNKTIHKNNYLNYNNNLNKYIHNQNYCMINNKNNENIIRSSSSSINNNNRNNSNYDDNNNKNDNNNNGSYKDNSNSYNNNNSDKDSNNNKSDNYNNNNSNDKNNNNMDYIDNNYRNDDNNKSVWNIYKSTNYYEDVNLKEMNQSNFSNYINENVNTKNEKNKKEVETKDINNEDEKEKNKLLKLNSYIEIFYLKKKVRLINCLVHLKTLCYPWQGTENKNIFFFNLSNILYTNDATVLCIYEFIFFPLINYFNNNYNSNNDFKILRNSPNNKQVFFFDEINSNDNCSSGEENFRPNITTEEVFKTKEKEIMDFGKDSTKKGKKKKKKKIDKRKIFIRKNNKKRKKKIDKKLKFSRNKNSLLHVNDFSTLFDENLSELNFIDLLNVNEFFLFDPFSKIDHKKLKSFICIKDIFHIIYLLECFQLQIDYNKTFFDKCFDLIMNSFSNYLKYIYNLKFNVLIPHNDLKKEFTDDYFSAKFVFNEQLKGKKKDNEIFYMNVLKKGDHHKVDNNIVMETENEENVNKGNIKNIKSTNLKKNCNIAKNSNFDELNIFNIFYTYEYIHSIDKSFKNTYFHPNLHNREYGINSCKSSKYFNNHTSYSNLRKEEKLDNFENNIQDFLKRCFQKYYMKINKNYSTNLSNNDVLKKMENIQNQNNFTNITNIENRKLKEALDMEKIKSFHKNTNEKYSSDNILNKQDNIINDIRIDRIHDNYMNENYIMKESDNFHILLKNKEIIKNYWDSKKDDHKKNNMVNSPNNTYDKNMKNSKNLSSFNNREEFDENYLEERNSNIAMLNPDNEEEEISKKCCSISLELINENPIYLSNLKFLNPILDIKKLLRDEERSATKQNDNYENENENKNKNKKKLYTQLNLLKNYTKNRDSLKFLKNNINHGIKKINKKHNNSFDNKLHNEYKDNLKLFEKSSSNNIVNDKNDNNILDKRVDSSITTNLNSNQLNNGTNNNTNFPIDLKKLKIKENNQINEFINEYNYVNEALCEPNKDMKKEKTGKVCNKNKDIKNMYNFSKSFLLTLMNSKLTSTYNMNNESIISNAFESLKDLSLNKELNNHYSSVDKNSTQKDIYIKKKKDNNTQKSSLIEENEIELSTSNSTTITTAEPKTNNVNKNQEVIYNSVIHFLNNTKEKKEKESSSKSEKHFIYSSKDMPNIKKKKSNKNHYIILNEKMDDNIDSIYLKNLDCSFNEICENIKNKELLNYNLNKYNNKNFIEVLNIKRTKYLEDLKHRICNRIEEINFIINNFLKKVKLIDNSNLYSTDEKEKQIFELIMKYVNKVKSVHFKKYKIKNISFDSNYNRYIAFFFFKNKKKSKSFSCKKYGGKENAKNEAAIFHAHYNKFYNYFIKYLENKKKNAKNIEETDKKKNKISEKEFFFDDTHNIEKEKKRKIGNSEEKDNQEDLINVSKKLKKIYATEKKFENKQKYIFTKEKKYIIENPYEI